MIISKLVTFLVLSAAAAVVQAGWSATISGSVESHDAKGGKPEESIALRGADTYIEFSANLTYGSRRPLKLRINASGKYLQFEWGPKGWPDKYGNDANSKRICKWGCYLVTSTDMDKQGAMYVTSDPSEFLKGYGINVRFDDLAKVVKHGKKPRGWTRTKIKKIKGVPTAVTLEQNGFERGAPLTNRLTLKSIRHH